MLRAQVCRAYLFDGKQRLAVPCDFEAAKAALAMRSRRAHVARTFMPHILVPQAAKAAFATRSQRAHVARAFMPRVLGPYPLPATIRHTFFAALTGCA